MTRLCRRMLPAVFALALAPPILAPALAQDQPKPPVPVARFSFASIDAFSKLITDLGIPMPGDLKGNIESAPFLGAGTVATDKPFGVVIVAADPQKLFPIPESMIIGMPVLKDKVTIDDLTKAGAKAVEGQPDTVTSPEFVLRRTTDYIFAKEPRSSPFGLSIMSDAIFAPEYKQPGTLAALSLNIDALRKSAPNAYKDFAQNVTNFPMFLFGMGAPGTPQDAIPVLAVLDKIDRFSMTLGQDGKDMHLKSWLMPTPFTAKSKESPRPAFPAGVIVQSHVVYPDAAAAGFLEKQLNAVSEDTLGELSELPPVYRARAKELLLRIAHLSTQSDAFSFAFTIKEGHPIFYIVDQLSQQSDALAELKSIANDAGALATESGAAKIAVDASSYDADGKKVQRLLIAEPAPGAGKIVIDGVQTGKVLYLALSDNADGKYVGDLASAGMNGTSSVLCAGAVDLGAMLKTMSETGSLPPGFGPDKVEALKKSFAGQGIIWTIQSTDQNFLYLDLSVPTDAVKELIKMNN